MKMIVIEEKIFDQIFDEVLNRLELEQLRASKNVEPEAYQHINDLHRKFHYEVSTLKDRLKR